MSLILIIGSKSDPHISGIAKELELLNENYVIVENFQFTDSFLVNLTPDKFSSYLNIKNKIILNDQIKSIWNSSALTISGKEKIAQEAIEFVYAEWSEGINSLWYSIRAFWMNHPYAISNSANRIKQLELANDIGLQIPKTIVTNDEKELKGFYDENNGNIIAKTLGSSQGLPDGKMIFTTKIEENDLKKSTNLSYCPTMFQEYVTKKTEIRANIIGKEISTVEIHSQNSKKTKHDWRHYDDFSKTPYVPFNLPKNIEKKLQKLANTLGLNFGAIDMIRTPDDDFVFLEINPNGRWWWIQELTNMNLANKIATKLSQSN